MKTSYFLQKLHYFLPALTPLRAYHLLSGFIGHKLSVLTGKPILLGLPYSCSIETTTRCNLKCPECPVGMEKLKRVKGDLSLEHFKRIVKDIQRHTSYLILYLQGEPLLNRDVPDMIRFATDFNIYTMISTNGHFLNQETAEKLVKAGLKKAIISVDGTTQQSYEKYRRNGHLDKVLEGIKNLVTERNKAGKQFPLIILQFIVFGSNEHEIDDVKKLGKALKVDNVEIKTAQHYDLSDKNSLITGIDKYCRYFKNAEGKWELKQPIQNRCIRLWTTAVITWNGVLIPCCYDKDADFAVGNLNDSGMKEIWRGKRFTDFRSRILTAKKTVGVCNNCGE